MRAILIDGYLDEPAALGVPPYISPYVRYVYGALVMRGYSVDYTTIDALRKENLWRFDHDLVIIFGGTTVPGHYLSGTPMSLSEVRKILHENRHAITVVSGPITRSYTLKGGAVALKPSLDADHVVIGDLWKFLEGFPEVIDHRARSDYEDIDRIAVYGAELIRKHPSFPNVICEIDISRGCERESFCSFCMEPVIHGRLKSRSVREIVEEVRALYEKGCRAFRLGRSANIIAYMSDRNGWKPSPEAIEELYSGIRSAAPDLEVLHTDNANPSYIVRHRESYKVVEIIARYNTPGDVLSFGVESFDEKVIIANNIGTSPEDVFEAIKLVNEIGSHRVDGVPKLLPGINLLYGLLGEDERTYEENYRFLMRVLESGYLLRRINIRQVIVHPGTLLFRCLGRKRRLLNKRLFKLWKDRIRRDIDSQMIKRVFPKGTVLRGVIPEKRKGKITFGRQLGTYPILVGSFSEFKEKSDMVVVDHGERSVTGVIYPVDLNSITFEELSSIDGIGRKRAEEIISKRPFKNLGDARSRLSPETWSALEFLFERRW